MKSRWCPQLSRPIPTLDAILAFGLLSILSCSGTVSCITERRSEQLYNWSPCTMAHHDYKEQFSGSSEAPENRCRISWLVQLVHSEEFALLVMSWTSSVVGPWPSVLLVLSGSWSPSVTICITAQQRARNASVIVPELAEIGDNYEFVNQFRPLWSPVLGAGCQFLRCKDRATFPESQKRGMFE